MSELDQEQQKYLETLQKKSLFISTPMYGGICTGLYSRSMNQLLIAAAKYGIPITTHTSSNESLIPRARNYSVDLFLQSDCEYFMFIDADIGFGFKDVLNLLYLCNEDKYSIIAGTYPKKEIAWEKVKAAVEAGQADEDPNKLKFFTADMVFNTIDAKSFQIDQPVEVSEIGTGFMMIHRSAFDKFKQAYPETSYIPDHVRDSNFDGSREINTYFHCEIDSESRRYLSEDYWFCRKMKKIGVSTWMCPWINLVHVGTYSYIGNMSALSTINVSPTVDKETIKNKK